MTNIFNYRYKELDRALRSLDKLEEKIRNKRNYSVTLHLRDGYWNLRLSMKNEQSNTKETRIFNTIA